MFGLGKLFDKATGLEGEFGPVTVCGHQLSCQVCQHGEFWHQKAQLHSPMATFFNMEFAGRSADCAICENCGYIHWFMPLNLAPTPTEEPDEPLSTQL
jgi:hypothetical protein